MSEPLPLPKRSCIKLFPSPTVFFDLAKGIVAAICNESDMHQAFERRIQGYLSEIGCFSLQGENSSKEGPSQADK